MLFNDRIKVVYKEGEDDGFNPDTGEYDKVEEESKYYNCNIMSVKDVVDDIPQGLISGKTLQAVFLQPTPRFEYAEYEGRTYRPISYEGTSKRMLVIMAEVVKSD